MPESEGELGEVGVGVTVGAGEGVGAGVTAGGAASVLAVIAVVISAELASSAGMIPASLVLAAGDRLSPASASASLFFMLARSATMLSSWVFSADTLARVTVTKSSMSDMSFSMLLLSRISKRSRLGSGS